MDRIYLLSAHFAYEGEILIRAFSTKVEAQVLADAGNAHASLRPDWDGKPDYKIRLQNWKDAAPLEYEYCDEYQVDEVPFCPT